MKIFTLKFRPKINSALKLFVLISLFIQSVQAEIATEADAWRILSANAQNLHDKIRNNRNVMADSSLYEKELKQIAKSFEWLKSKRVLLSKTIKIDPKKLEEFFDKDGFFDRLMEDDGFFVASEMLDCRRIYRDNKLSNLEEVQLTLHLPPD